MLSLLLALTLLDPRLTPGAVRPLTETQVCALSSLNNPRRVTTRMRRQVLRSYGIAWEDRHLWVIDHLIPRSLGGADVVANLMPQSPADATIKDREEMRLWRAVCMRHRLSLAVAQEAMRTWRP